MKGKFAKVMGVMTAAMMLCPAGQVFAEESAAQESPYAGEERQKISVMSITFNANPVDDTNALVQALEEYTNYDIEWTWMLDSDYTDKISTMMAGGTLPEITILKNLNANEINNCRAGAFWDLTDYLDDYPNLSQIDDIVKNNISIDGRIYGIPRTRSLMREGIIYRQDWLDNLGLEPATNLEEFENILRAFTFDDPDGNGKDDTWGLVRTKTGFGFETWFGAPNGWGEDEEGNLQPSFLFDGYLESLKWGKKLYDEGILADDFMVRENSGEKDAFKAQESGVSARLGDVANEFYSYFQQEGIDAKLTVTAAIETKDGKKVTMPTNGHAGLLAVSKAAAPTEEDLKRCLTFLDRCNDAYAQNLFSYGIEGVDYTINDDGTVSKTQDAINGGGSLDGHDGFNQIMMNVVPLYYQTRPASYVAEEVTAATEENLKYALANPGLPLQRQSEVYREMGAALDQMINDAAIQYIVGEIDDDGWNAVIEEWRAQGGDSLIEEINELYQQSKENNEK